MGTDQDGPREAVATTLPVAGVEVSPDQVRQEMTVISDDDGTFEVLRPASSETPGYGELRVFVFLIERSDGLLSIERILQCQ